MNLCRICLFKVEKPFVEETFYDDSIQLKTIIQEIFNGKVNLTARELDTVCLQCREKIVLYFEFYQLVLENQDKYEKLVTKPKQAKTNPEAVPDAIDENSSVSYGGSPERDFSDDNTQADESQVIYVKVEPTPIRCLKCPDKKLFENFLEFQTHARTKHSKTSPPRQQEPIKKKTNKSTTQSVPIKDKRLSTKADIKVEVNPVDTVKAPVRGNRKKVIDTENLTCEKCNQMFENLSTLRYHRALSHSSCEICGLNYMKERFIPSAVWAHEQQHALSDDPHQPLPFVCDFCGKEELTRKKISQHFYRHHRSPVEKSTIVCEQCGMEFGYKHELNTHMTAKHPEGGMKVPCKICGIMIRNNKVAFKHHFKNIHDAQPTQCTACGQVSRSQKAAKEHYRRMHTEPKYECKDCGKKFSVKDRLREHEATHLGINLFFCTLCNAQYKNKANFAAHKRRNHPKEYEIEKAQKKAKLYLPDPE